MGEELSIISFKRAVKYYLDKKILDSQFTSLNQLERNALLIIEPFCDKIIKDYKSDFDDMYNKLSKTDDIKNMNALAKIIKHNKPVLQKLTSLSFAAVLVYNLTKNNNLVDAQILSHYVACDMSNYGEEILHYLQQKKQLNNNKGFFTTTKFICCGIISAALYYYLIIK
ncbi:anti-apoptotic factor [Hypsugopox virus]|nr:anti-apoptotic factor [Hypsugopox virus]